MAFQDIEIVNGRIIRRLQSKDGMHVHGFLTLPVNYDGTNPTDVKEFEHYKDAKESLLEYVYTKVDGYNGYAIIVRRERGVISPSGYLIRKAGEDDIKCYSLTEARNLLGMPAAQSKPTLAKSEYMHNQKGYKAGSGSSSKKGK